jgi:hypoxanthine-DNA glycosylase
MLPGDIAESFPPIETPDAAVLVLGTMPGRASLRANEYYAHRRNAFWDIMFRIFGAEAANVPYPSRVDFLHERKIALWDVLKTCRRVGSLDQNIEQETANDFAGFFEAHPMVRTIVFNGGKSQACFRRHVGLRAEHQYLLMPSTSPAHTMRISDKAAAWRRILDFLG